MEPKTNVRVKLIGEDQNAFSIIKKVMVELKRAGHYKLAEDFCREASSSDFDNVLQTCFRYVEIE